MDMRKRARAPFHVLVATDGSPDARKAGAAAVAFPWPAGASASAVVARGLAPAGLSRAFGRALESTLEQIAEEARQALAARWPEVKVKSADGSAVRAILAEARRRRARAIVLGAQGHGRMAELLLGSVSRNVVQGAPCAVLVARGEVSRFGNLVLGVDGSAEARRAIDLVARLVPSPDGRVTMVSVAEPIRMPSLGMLPARARAVLGGEATALEAQRLQAAEREAEAAATRLERAGWRPKGVVRSGAPAPELLRAAREARADLIVIGARGAGGVERLLLGSVADAVLAQAPMSVLIAR